MSAVCPDCGATVSPVRIEGGDEMVPLDLIPDIRGEHRYRIASWSNLTCEPVAPDADVSAYPDHNFTCAVKQREREKRGGLT